MFARVLDQLEGQSVRFDHVVTDEYDGDRDAYISQIPEFRRMLKRARSVAAVRRSLDELCFGQKTLEVSCEEVRERMYLPYRRLTARLAELLREQVATVLGTLSSREREVIEYRFGLGDGYGRTLEEVGRYFNVTRERVRQIESKALRKLRHPSRLNLLREYFLKSA